RGWLYVNCSSGTPRRDYRVGCVPHAIGEQCAPRGRYRLEATGAYGNIHNAPQPWLRAAAPGLSETSCGPTPEQMQGLAAHQGEVLGEFHECLEFCAFGLC